MCVKSNGVTNVDKSKVSYVSNIFVAARVINALSW